MCGFCSYFHFDSGSQQGFYNLDLDNALQSIHHRGPDSKGRYVSPDGRCALGHVRLSIIDLESGQQPLSNASGSIQSVVNGELYDFERIREELQAKGHEFSTKSDSEIVLHLYEEYGLSFLDHLRGEFALNIYDVKRSRFIAARDRFGIKPLYYTVSNGTLLVASEIKAFISMGWKAEWDIDSIVNNGIVADARTCFKGVYKLPPGHYLVATCSGSIEIRQYWDADYPDKNIKETRTVEEMVQGVHDRLIEAIRHRLKADVPLGVYLSGGVDSSCIAGIASKLLKEANAAAKLRVFSISFNGGDMLDESAIAERTAQFCNAEFAKLSLTEDDLLARFEESVWYMEDALGNLNSVGKFILSEFVRDQGYKVVLTGEGSDEHFGGYGFFHGDYLREADKATPGGFGAFTKEHLAMRSKHTAKSDIISKFAKIKGGLPVAESARKMVNSVNTHVILGDALSCSNNIFSNAAISRCGYPAPALAMVEGISGIARSKANTKWHPLHTAMYIESHTMLPNRLCTLLGDRSEMAHSIEARTPFLDHHLCEYVNSLPPSLKIKTESDGSLNEKWVLKEAVKPYITDEIYNRTKHPYIAPLSKHRNPILLDLINKFITKENLDNIGWVNTDKFIEDRDVYLKSGNLLLFRNMLIMISYVILSQRFDVATWGISDIVTR